MPKRLRADLHERLADWLETQAARRRTRSSATTSSRPCAYRREHRRRGRARPRRSPPRRRTGWPRAARAALARGDAAAGARLLERAESLLGGRRSRPRGAPVHARRRARRRRPARGRRSGARGGDRACGARRATRGSSHARSWTSSSCACTRGRAAGSSRRGTWPTSRWPHLDRHDDHVGRCRAWRLRAWIDWIECQSARADEAWGRAATHARRAGDERELFDILGWRASAAVFGPTPVGRRDPPLRADPRAGPEQPGRGRRHAAPARPAARDDGASSTRRDG